MSREVIFVATRAGLIGIDAVAIVRATITDAIRDPAQPYAADIWLLKRAIARAVADWVIGTEAGGKAWRAAGQPALAITDLVRFGWVVGRDQHVGSVGLYRRLAGRGVASLVVDIVECDTPSGKDYWQFDDPLFTADSIMGHSCITPEPTP